MVFEEKTITSETVFKGRIIDVRVDTVELPSGNRTYRDIVDHPGGVGVIAITDDDKIIMVRQFRKAIEKAVLEIPAGKLDAGEDPLQCGKRELLEETGIRARKYTFLGEIYTTPAFVDEVIYMYLATDLEDGCEQCLDSDEFLNVEKIPLDTLVEMTLKGEIRDAKTQAAVLKVDAMRRRGMI